MAYPKPLSEKSIQKLYDQSGISKEGQAFLHRLFLASINLYGVIPLCDMWEVYQRIAEREQVPKIKKRDLVSFSAIVRREKHPYQVYELDELFSEEKRKDFERHVVEEHIIGKGHGRLAMFYDLIDNAIHHTYFIPDDFWSYETLNPGKEEQALYDFLCSLRSSAEECVPKYGKGIPNVNKGKCLDEFSFLNAHERFELHWLEERTKRTKDLAVFLEDTCGTEAEKVLRHFKYRENIGWVSMTASIGYVTEELEEAGVQFTEESLKTLLRLLTEYHNNSHLWCLRGWTPKELATRNHSHMDRLPDISFGPGMQKAFEEGTIDKEEFIRRMGEMGFGVPID